MTTMLKLIRSHNIQPAQVVSVKVGTNQNMPNALIHHRPTTELQAKFSMEFCMAILLLEQRGGLNKFTDEIVNRPDVQAMIRKIDFGVHPEAEAAGYDKMTTILEIALTDGRVIRDRADFGKGSPANPMSYEEVADKFRECAAYSRWPKSKAEQVVAMVRAVEEVRDVREMTALLTRTSAGTGTAKAAKAPGRRSARGTTRKPAATRKRSR
jgi:2-methylcitrate dehydratase PrpD